MLKSQYSTLLPGPPKLRIYVKDVYINAHLRLHRYPRQPSLCILRYCSPARACLFEFCQGPPGHRSVAAGLSPKTAEAAAAGLPNTLFAVLVRKDGRVVGMGRLVGDGGLFFQVVDIAVEPRHH